MVENYPEEDTRSRVEELHTCGGGETATAMRALARWGVASRLIGRVGQDDAGRHIREALGADGVDISRLDTVPGAPTRQSFIVVNRATGMRTVFSTTPATVAMRAGEVDGTMLDGVSLLHLDGSHGPAALELAREAHRRGIPLMLDASRTPPQIEELMALADYLVADAAFALAFTGLEGAEGVRALHRERPRTLTAATFGLAGCHAVLADGTTLHQPAFSISPAVDTTGAGDLFHAAVDFGIVRGWPIGRTLRWASAAGALACRALGSQGGIPSAAEVDALGGGAE